MTRGRFIVLEGGEGAGKSTQCRAVADWLRARGREVVTTREPGGSPLAEAIRGVVLGDWGEGVDGTTELLLIFAARAAHLHATVVPALDAGRDVVCDRFVDATYAYQGGGRGMDGSQIDHLADAVVGGNRPDLVLVLDIDPELGLARARARGEINRFEAEALVFQTRVRDTYLRRAAAAPERYAVIDAGGDVTTVRRAIEAVLEARL